MSIAKVKEHLEKLGFEDRLMEFEVSSATVAEAAKALDCMEAEIAKTLSFMHEDGAILIVAAGDGKVDNAKFKAEFKMKAKMIPFELVEEMTGHAAGGVCPFGVNDNAKVYLDISLKRFDIVYPAGGNSMSAVRLSIEELEKASGYIRWVDVCKEIV